MLKESTLDNKRHYTLRCITWYKQWAWREPQHTGFCITVHVRSRLLLYAAVSRSGYPGADRIQDGGRREGGGGRGDVCERAPGTSRVMKVREKGKNGCRRGCGIDRTCYFLDYSRRESRSTVGASQLSPGGNGRSISLSCVNVLLPLFPLALSPFSRHPVNRSRP